MMKYQFATKLNMNIKGKKATNDMEKDIEILENFIKDKNVLDASLNENTISEWPKDAANDLSYSKMKHVTSLRHPKKLVNG